MTEPTSPKLIVDPKLEKKVQEMQGTDSVIINMNPIDYDFYTPEKEFEELKKIYDEQCVQYLRWSIDLKSYENLIAYGKLNPLEISPQAVMETSQNIAKAKSNISLYKMILPEIEKRIISHQCYKKSVSKP
jgi:hypothetical protein